MNLLLVSIGGAVGAICRYLLGLVMMKRYSESPFPIAMLVVNMIGSLGLGLFYGFHYGQTPAASAYEEPLFLLIALGFFGAFTTYSTFSIEAVQLFQKKLWKPLLAYISLSIVGSILMFVIGLMMMK
ncbi:fluoride efflux transporter CrcB [Halalkalibacter nanhaiisediminis]|uniref:Fluoride-specific ion channel FluC n=1 Tax=Halalkalibacter nanhaiisediminis TaxID=688079 RepID=A0A562QB26_9BACI|nr:fluoride efflux transporter CrcB [Halalkalibacter nanhaiisediminis]TWI53942.1 camphor resistance protein CrcB [Halalkalibacter nanhaiisediminis]